jgi:DNA mismatch endonuclease (patch repair protein)
MTDVYSKDKRSWVMSRIKSQDTGPEIKIRSLVHRLGYRFRLHRKDLPGKPDLVFPARRKIIFVHGCFWHGHSCRKGQHMPETSTDYWRGKIEKTITRDRETVKALHAAGWQTLIIWECEIKNDLVMIASINNFLN